MSAFHHATLFCAKKPEGFTERRWAEERRNAIAMHLKNIKVRMEREKLSDNSPSVMNYRTWMLGPVRTCSLHATEKDCDGECEYDPRYIGESPMIALDANVKGATEALLKRIERICEKERLVEEAIFHLKREIDRDPEDAKLLAIGRGYMPIGSIHANAFEKVVRDFRSAKQSMRDELTYLSRTIECRNHASESCVSSMLDMSLKLFAFTPCSATCFAESTTELIRNNQPRAIKMYTPERELTCIACQKSLFDEASDDAIHMQPKRVLNASELRAVISGNIRSKDMPTDPCSCECFSMCLTCLLLHHWEKTSKGVCEYSVCPFCRGYYSLKDIVRVKYATIGGEECAITATSSSSSSSEPTSKETKKKKKVVRKKRKREELGNIDFDDGCDDNGSERKRRRTDDGSTS